ncbi:alpha-D-ribose 1-methylphosphonate 5-triphosphate diphosphatase [Pseudonocardia xinjiangensis]|uniref:Alpha-D-ribose 1-methylphosphonate 5-triphosphate diphosphatase n=1 Tax=Pseudonocardia xinjiangensis TaxID=75289 RepID=A0ABX1R8B1_9PSEU|nr:alpha-D-ribose 1-methylphosphonate 5-triphosphate diphosphatase [Pseudonocardia xinjiangensis]NMH76621.1 alpha-D-ribose 1-methylphosphonate 5-triphosphate diphosphatase [Pseudonocardia xinjiangensis]
MSHARTAVRWTLGAPPLDYVLGHVRAVLPDRVVDDARVAVRDGRIAEVGPHPPGSEADVDGAGLLCVPGVVDVHSDGLEREVLPRPGARLPWEFAILSFEGKLRAAGVTTVFHGASFEEGTSPSTVRTVATTRELCAAVAERGVAAVDHRILHRLDVRSPEGLAALRERLAGASPGDVPALVSHEDHTPGQGQYADRSHYERYVAGTRGLSDGEARDHVDRLIIERDDRLPIRAEALDWLGGLARSGAIRLLGHDPASAAEIDDLVARGGAVAEFPTTLEAAAAARERGLPVVAGAPNVLRGRSHAGNVSGGELAARGLLTALASDYLPSGLVPAAFLLAARGVVSLPAAVALVTAGPAEVAGLTDRGRLGAGVRADLVLVEPGEPWPVIRSVLRAETL